MHGQFAFSRARLQQHGPDQRRRPPPGRLRALYADTTRLNDQGSKAARQLCPHLEVWRNPLNPDYDR